MVEVWPYAERSRGIAYFQLFGRLAGFFTTFVNPIGLDSVGWKYLISYCCWLAYEVVFVYFFFPETFGRTLEELAFSKFSIRCRCRVSCTDANISQCSRTSTSPTRLCSLSRRSSATTMATEGARTRSVLPPSSRRRFKFLVICCSSIPL